MMAPRMVSLSSFICLGFLTCPLSRRWRPAGEIRWNSIVNISESLLRVDWPEHCRIECSAGGILEESDKVAGRTIGQLYIVFSQGTTQLHDEDVGSVADDREVMAVLSCVISQELKISLGLLIGADANSVDTSWIVALRACRYVIVVS